MDKMRLFFILLISISILGIVSCSDEDSDNNDENENGYEYLITAEEKYGFVETAIEGVVSFPGIQDAITSGVEILKIVYKTTYDGEEIEASGTLSLPDQPGNYPLVLVQRGTILENSAAPSESVIPSYEFFAGMGYAVFVPDLIGYGASNDILHPYFDYNYTVSATMDMYRAVNEYMTDNQELTAKLNDKFFISGYSQGGYSAMATYKYISENVSDIDITAVGVGAGGYNIMSIVENVLQEDTYPYTILLTMPMVTYNELYLNRPLTDIFNSPYDAMIQEVIDGDKEWIDIAEALPNVLLDLFNNDLIADIRDGESTFLTQYIVENSVHDWAPQESTKLYHYPLDEIIPIETTYSTLETMQNNGALDISFVEVPDSLVTPGGSAHGAAGIAAIYMSFLDFANN
jgi:pimeloyl-ACP methyl ester carboxylesterase